MLRALFDADHVVFVNISVTVFHDPIGCRLYAREFSTRYRRVQRIGLKKMGFVYP